MLSRTDACSSLGSRSFITIENNNNIEALIQEAVELVEENSKLRVFTGLRVAGMVEDSLSLVQPDTVNAGESGSSGGARGVPCIDTNHDGAAAVPMFFKSFTHSQL